MNKILFLAAMTIFLFTACKSKDKSDAKATETVKEEKAPLLDLRTFFRNSEKGSFRMSPDGNYFSYRSDYKGMMNIFVQKTTDTVAVRVTSDTVRSISQYFWKGSRIVYLQDFGGDENDQLFSVNPDGTDTKSLTPFPGVKALIIDVLDEVPGKEKDLMIGLNKRVKEYFDPYSINVETGALNLLYENKQNYDGWVSDNSGLIRLASKSDGVNVSWFYRGSEKDSFALLVSTTFKESFNPASFDKNNKNLYVLNSIGRDKVSLVEYDPIAKQEVKEIFSDKDYDLSSIFYDRKKQALAYVSWDAEKRELHFFDKKWEKIQLDLEKKLEGNLVEVMGTDDARTKAIVWSGNDRKPGNYYLYDLKSLDLKEVANPVPWIIEQQMSHMKPVSYKSRDGLTIHGYLTLPVGVEAKNLPAIVNPHGGPWYRDVWGFNNEVQFLANRGYAVLQMNFRGSTGYGKNFWQASFKEWGKKMQDDITDGVEYLKKEGIADPKRVAIYGGSYGGYATLAGITFTPDLYAAAVDYVGVSNIFTFIKSVPPYWKPYLDQFYEMVGNPKKDSLLLAEASPALHADKIKTPLFVAQGANDPRVNKNESDQMVAALKKRGVDVEYMVKNDEGHGFYNQDNQYDFYGAMEKFLDKHLKGDAIINKPRQ